MIRILATTALVLGMMAAPAMSANLIETLEGKDEYSTFLEAVKASDAKWFIEEDVKYTAFVPTNEAFEQLPEGVLDALLKEENKPALTMVLEAHVIPDEMLKSDQISPDATLDPAAGEPYEVSVDGDTIMIGEANVTEADIEADQGVAHGINQVLVPEIVSDALAYRMEQSAN